MPESYPDDAPVEQQDTTKPSDTINPTDAKDPVDNYREISKNIGTLGVPMVYDPNKES